MKYFFLALSSSIYFAFSLYVSKLIKVEMIVYELYTSNFNEYLYMNEDFSFCFYEERLKDLFNQAGYDVIFGNDEFSFEVSFNCFFSFKKVYSFYLEKNDGI